MSAVLLKNFPNGLRFPLILTADVSADLPNSPVARLRLMANTPRRVGWSLINICNMLIFKCLCEFFVDKKFELRSEVCDQKETQSAKYKLVAFFDCLNCPAIVRQLNINQ